MNAVKVSKNGNLCASTSKDLLANIQAVSRMVESWLTFSLSTIAIQPWIFENAASSWNIIAPTHKTLSTSNHILLPSQYSEIIALGKNLVSYCEWIVLSDPSIILHGPFDLQPFITVRLVTELPNMTGRDWLCALQNLTMTKRMLRKAILSCSVSSSASSLSNNLNPNQFDRSKGPSNPLFIFWKPQFFCS